MYQGRLRTFLYFLDMKDKEVAGIVFITGGYK